MHTQPLMLSFHINNTTLNQQPPKSKYEQSSFCTSLKSKQTFENNSIIFFDKISREMHP